MPGLAVEVRDAKGKLIRSGHDRRIDFNFTKVAPFKGVWGPVYRMLADLGDPARSRWQLTTGQSGHPASPHYDDMIEGWRTGRTNPVYVDEHELRGAGGAKQLRLDPDY